MGVTEEESKYITWKLGMTTSSGRIRDFNNEFAIKMANELD